MMDDQLKRQIKELQEQLRILAGVQPGKRFYSKQSFQMPNFVIDFLDAYLTPIETKVLHRVIREIWGWDDRPDIDKNHVSISKMQRGYTKKDGEVGCLGIGLTHETIEKALNTLCEYKILKKETREQRGVLFFFSRNVMDYDLEKMLENIEKRKALGKKRMTRARAENPKVKNG